jgi:hypothetical protein
LLITITRIAIIIILIAALVNGKGQRRQMHKARRNQKRYA